jgi:hypothetical protein
VGYCPSDDRYQEPGILSSEIEIKHHEKKEEDNDASSLLVDNVPVDERENHAEKGGCEVTE